MNERPVIARRLVRHLHESAIATHLPPGSETGIVRTARRRQYRRRQLAAAASVVAVGGVGALGIQQLSRPGAPQVATTGDAPGGTPVPPAAPAVNDPATPRPAVGEPQLTWRTIRPDSAAAVATSYSSGMGGVGTGPVFPGVIVSTSPAAAESPLFQLWRSEDGIDFTLLDDRAEGRALLRAGTFGDRIYTFGTAPGVAATDPNPLLASVSDDAGVTWSDIALPVDTHRFHATSGVESVSVTAERIAVDGEAVMVAVRTHVTLDWQELGIDEPDLYVSEVTAEGITLIPSRGECDALHPEVRAELDRAGAAEAVDLDAPDCEVRTLTWADLEALGLDAEVIDAIGGTSIKLFHAADGRTFTEVSPPVGGGPGGTWMWMPSDTMHVVAVSDTAGVGLWRTADGITWDELPPLPGEPYSMVELDGRLVAIHCGDCTGFGGLQVSTLDGDAWSTVDLATLVPGTIGMYMIGAGDAGLALAVATETVTHAEQVTAGLGPHSDEPVDDSTDESVTEPTTVEVEPGKPAWHVLHTSDGTTWSSERLDEITDDLAGQPRVERIAGVDGQLLVTVTLNDTKTETEPNRQLVLVGTPTS